MTEPTEDELLEAALAAVDQPLPQSPEPPEPDSHEPTPPQPDGPASPTLAALDESRRPKAKTVCEDCPNSVWFSSPAEVKCYCRVMFLVTWSNKEPNQLTACDGIFLGQDD
uniref:TraH conjugative transfer protein, relaxosome stabilization n=1 Tax=uncultured bacterium pAKD4 TaxID=743682 RepID=D4N5K6_9BACT|nr:TraH conjugative transfer protein, relaxosome stabilization [uncultured bacterium pAKD4]